MTSFNRKTFITRLTITVLVLPTIAIWLAEVKAQSPENDYNYSQLRTSVAIVAAGMVERDGIVQAARKFIR